MNADELESPELESQADRVIADLKARTLEQMPSVFSRLIYLASLRDHNTGEYHHYGLESRYGAPAVDAGLRECHEEAFEALNALSLKAQTEDLITFFNSQQVDRARLVEAWEKLRSYQILPPENCHHLVRELFEANMEIVLRILRETELWPLLHDPHRDPNHLP